MKHPVDVHVGQKIRHRRWLVGMTQQQLATAVGIKFQQIQKYESGANRVSASRLWDMAKTMKVPVSYFFEGLDGEAPEDAASSDAIILQDKETAELIRAYYSIRPEMRRHFVGLMHTLAGAKTEHAA